MRKVRPSCDVLLTLAVLASAGVPTGPMTELNQE